MKKNVRFFLPLFICCLGSLALFAQDLIIEPELAEPAFENVAISNFKTDLADYISITNNTDEVMELKWERVLHAGEAFSNWDSQICDNNLCYGFAINTNYDPSINIVKPFILQPGETFDDFALHIWPRHAEGCGQYKILFSRISAPDEIIGVAHFNASVNTPDCTFLSSTNEQQEVAHVNVFPNPTFNQFTLSDNQVVKSLDLYNILGKQMKTFTYSNGEYFDLSDFADGMYLVSMRGKDGEVLKTVRLVKRG